MGVEPGGARIILPVDLEESGATSDAVIAGVEVVIVSEALPDLGAEEGVVVVEGGDLVDGRTLSCRQCLRTISLPIYQLNEEISTILPNKPIK